MKSVIKNPKPHSCVQCKFYPWQRDHEPPRDKNASCRAHEVVFWTKKAPFYTNKCEFFEEAAGYIGVFA